MPEDLKLRVLTDGDTRGLDKTARGLDGLADKAEGAEKSTKGLGDEVDKTSKKTEGLGRQSKRTGHDIVDLDRRIIELKASLKGLNDEYERSGKLDRRKFNADNRELSGLQRAKKVIEGLGDETGRWSKILDSVIDKIPGIGKLGGMLGGNTGALAATAAIAFPAAIGAGATAGGLITGATGLGVAGAGIAGAAMGSEKVRAEWASTIADIKAQFLDATRSFEGPTIAAIAKIRNAFRDIDMKKIFGDASKFVEPLADGASRALRSIGQGIQYVVARTGPVIAAISGGVAEMGDAVRVALEEISDGSEGGAKALSALFTGISDLVVLTGTWIGWFEDAFDAVDKLGRGLRDTLPQVDAMADAMGQTDEPKSFARTLDFAKDSAEGLAAALSDMSSEARIANDRFSELFGIMMNVDEANLAVKLGLTGLREAMQDGNLTRDETTEKVLRQIQLLQDQRNAELATGDGSAAATGRINANYQSQLEQLKRMFPWLEGIIDKYEKLSQPLTKHITVIIDQVGSVSREGVVSGGDQRTRVGSGYASGTTSARAGWAVVGEEGPELVNFGGGETVLNAGDTSRAYSSTYGGAGMSTGGGGRTVTVVFAGNTDTAFATAFAELVRSGIVTVN